MKISNQDKGLFLQEFYGIKEIPTLVDKEGNPTKFAEAAKYWGENIPKTESDVKHLVSKGAALIATENLSVSQKFSTNSVYGGRQELSILRPNQIKVPFVKTGAWKHDVYGEVKFTDDDIQQLIDNYKKNVTGFTPYLTLGHLDEEPDSTDSHRKRGDLRDIIVEEGTAFGVFDVNDDIYQSIENGEYEYSSGEFNRRFTDKETGKDVGTAVIRVALTNSPFLPFGSKKVQALSDSLESCPETKENYVFLLSIDTSNSDNSASNEVTNASAEEPKQEDVKKTIVEEQPQSDPVEETKPEHIKNTTLLNNKSIMAQDQTKAVEENVNPAAVTTEEPATVATEAPAKLDSADQVVIRDSNSFKTEKSLEADSKENAVLANLTSQLAKVQELYQAQLEVANKTITALTSKVDALTDKLAGQELVTQQFSNSMSQAQENAMIMNLQNNGVQPANIQKFLAFKNAFQTADNKNIVKFSVGVGEEAKVVEANVIDTVADLLISASNQTPLVEQQLGISAGRKSGTFDFSSIIEKNQAAAEKLSSK